MSIVTSFVAEKSRIAPLKCASIPRRKFLEVLLTARLSKKMSKELIFPAMCYFRTYAIITLFWFREKLERFKMLVRNRIKEIRYLIDTLNWFHYPGKDNLVDAITTDFKVLDLKKKHLWFKL